MMKNLYIHISKTLNVYENLAIETKLLDYVTNDNLILFLWQNEKTVVIGQNQNPLSECKTELLKADGIKIARRLSGGGAVFHDIGNLNFTFLCSSENCDLKKQSEIIKTACAFAGIDAEISGRNDILVGKRKFSGNAFYNSKNKTFHHGTLLINADLSMMDRYLTPPKAKLESKGVKSVTSRVINLAELVPDLTCNMMKNYMISATEKIYSLKSKTIPVTEISDPSLAKKYACWDYIYATPIPCTLLLENRFPWGNIQIRFVVKNGVVENLQIFSDSLDHKLSDKLKKALENKSFESKNILSHLEKELEKEVARDIFNLIKRALS